MKIERTALDGVLVLTPPRHGDARGFFSESWNKRTLETAGVDMPGFVQDNHSMSAAEGTLRGLHFQAPPHAQGKLVRCGRGAFFDVVVDIRRGSPTYGDWFGGSGSEAASGMVAEAVEAAAIPVMAMSPQDMFQAEVFG